MNLKTYIKESDLTRGEFAKKIGIKLSYLHNICQHPEQTGKKTVLKINKVTNGAVTFDDMWPKK